MSQFLHKKISAVRRKQSLVSFAQGLAAAVGAAVLLLAAGMFLDYFLELPHGVRVALLVIDVLVVGYIVIWHIFTPMVFGPDDESIALMVEHEMPDFCTRLIASVQLSRPAAIPAGVSQAIVNAMISQTEEMAQPRDFTAVIKPDSMLRTMAIAAFILLVGAATFVWGQPASKALLARALLSDQKIPRRVDVECISRDQVVAIGDAVRLKAIVHVHRGEMPTSGKIILQYPKRKQEFTIDPSPEDARIFVRSIDNVQESFDYTIRLGDNHSEMYHVRAEPRPALLSVEFEQEYPPYTNRPSERRQPGNLALLPGSKLRAKVTTNKPVKEASARTVGASDVVAPMKADSADRMHLTHTITITGGMSGVTFDFVDDNGIPSRGSTVFPIEIVPDKEPTVRVTWPLRKEELATQQARVLVAFEAGDDFGLNRVSLRYKYEMEDDAAAKTVLLLDGADAAVIRDLATAIADAIVQQRQIVDAVRGKPASPADSAALRERLTKLAERLDALRGKVPSFAGEAPTHLKNASEGMQLAGGFIKSQRWDAALEAAAGALTGLEQAVAEVDLRRVRRRHEFNLGALRPLAQEGAIIEYWVQVEDANNVTGPGRANSEHYKVKVVSEEEKRADLMSRLNDQLGTVQWVTEDQDKLSRTLGALIQEK